MYLQEVDSIWDLRWNDRLRYGQIWLEQERQQCRYNFAASDPQRLLKLFQLYEAEAGQLAAQGLAVPALDWVLKCSHCFNLLDARGVISVTERQRTILRIRKLAAAVAVAWQGEREAMGYPLLRGAPVVPVWPS